MNSLPSTDCLKQTVEFQGGYLDPMYSYLSELLPLRGLSAGRFLMGKRFFSFLQDGWAWKEVSEVLTNLFE